MSYKRTVRAVRLPYGWSIEYLDDDGQPLRLGTYRPPPPEEDEMVKEWLDCGGGIERVGDYYAIFFRQHGDMVQELGLWDGYHRCGTVFWGGEVLSQWCFLRWVVDSPMLLSKPVLPTEGGVMTFRQESRNVVTFKERGP